MPPRARTFATQRWAKAFGFALIFGIVGEDGHCSVSTPQVISMVTSG
jgi:hypothetical protein